MNADKKMQFQAASSEVQFSNHGKYDFLFFPLAIPLEYFVQFWALHFKKDSSELDNQRLETKYYKREIEGAKNVWA